LVRGHSWRVKRFYSIHKSAPHIHAYCGFPHTVSARFTLLCLQCAPPLFAILYSRQLTGQSSSFKHKDFGVQGGGGGGLKQWCLSDINWALTPTLNHAREVVDAVPCGLVGGSARDAVLLPWPAHKGTHSCYSDSHGHVFESHHRPHSQQ
jgi:hypothetical protein